MYCAWPGLSAMATPVHAPWASIVERDGDVRRFLRGGEKRYARFGGGDDFVAGLGVVDRFQRDGMWGDGRAFPVAVPVCCLWVAVALRATMGPQPRGLPSSRGVRRLPRTLHAPP